MISDSYVIPPNLPFGTKEKNGPQPEGVVALFFAFSKFFVPDPTLLFRQYHQGVGYLDPLALRQDDQGVDVQLVQPRTEGQGHL